MNTNNSTTENNKLIAEFLHGKNATHPNQYHENWNELIQVVEKIEFCYDGDVDFNIYKYGTSIHLIKGRVDIYSNVADISFEHKIEHVYDACVEFIKYYNENK